MLILDDFGYDVASDMDEMICDYLISTVCVLMIRDRTLEIMLVWCDINR